MNNTEAAIILEREDPDLYWSIRALVMRPTNPHEIGEMVLKATGDERLANLSECAAVYHIAGR